jgi:hypothetical protein
MKFEVTNPKIWKSINEKDIPMSHKIKVYEKLGGAYRLGEDGGEQVFNKLTELLKYKMNEGDESSPEETLMGLKNMAMGDLERIADYANMILQRMEQGQELSSWMYSQITLAVDQLNSVHDSMDGKDGVKEPLKEGKYDKDLDKIEAVVKNATSFMNVGAELKKAGIKYGFHTSDIPMYLIKVSGRDNAIVICNKKYVSGADREVNDIAIGLLN